MDIKSQKIIGRTFLGNNVNPHMVMMSPDGKYIVTGGTRANKAYIIDSHTLELVKVIAVDIAPEHLAFSPDSRWYYQGNPEGDSISVIDMQSLTKIKTIKRRVSPRTVEQYRKQVVVTNQEQLGVELTAVIWSWVRGRVVLDGPGTLPNFRESHMGVLFSKALLRSVTTCGRTDPSRWRW